MSFGFYGLLRKKVSVDAKTGLFIETLLLLPVAAVYLLFIADTPTSNMLTNPLTLNSLLIAAGVITTLHCCALRVQQQDSNYRLWAFSNI